MGKKCGCIPHQRRGVSQSAHYKKPPAHTLNFEMKGDCYFGAAD